MRVQDCNWMQLEEYLRGDDRIVLPFGSIEQHAYLSLGVDMILSERVAVEAAEPLGVPVMPSLPYGITPYFAAYPGSPTLSVETYQAVVRELLDSLHGQGFRRFVLVNGHGGNDPGGAAAEPWQRDRPDAQAVWHNWWNGPRTWEVVQSIDSDASHASWLENFPWTRLAGVTAARSESRWPTSRGSRAGSRRSARRSSATARSAACTSGPTTTCCASGARASRKCAI